MRVKDGPELDQAGECELGRTHADRRADGSVRHPCGKLSRETRPDLDIEELTAATSVPRIEANPLTVKRMPGILHHDEL